MGGILEALQCTETVLTAGGEVPAPNTGQMAIQGSQTLVEADPSQSLLECNQALMINQLSPKNRDRRPQGPNGQKENTDRDIWELLRALPTKNDIQQLISAVEQSCLQAVESLKEDIWALGHRVEKMETNKRP